MIDQGMQSGDAPISVLIVDDSKTVRRYLESFLRGRYLLMLAADGMEAVRCLREQGSEICLLDMNMPRMDGLEVIRHVRNTLRDNDLYILVLTADDSSEQKTTALNAGANDYLIKPVEEAELLARIGVAERQVRLTRSLRRAYAAIYQEIDQIAQLQRRLLPTASPLIPGIAVQSLYVPSSQASGDYFDYFTLPDGGLRVVMADVSGHGARAAFIMSMVRTMIRFTNGHGRDLARLFSLINDQLRFFVSDEGDFVTLFAADIHPGRGIMEFINAGHTPVMVVIDHASPQRLKATMPALGVFPIAFTTQSTQLGETSIVFLFTDGCYEWESSSGAMHDLETFWDRCAAEVDKEGFVLNELFPLLGWPEKPPLRDDASALWIRLQRSGEMHTIKNGMIRKQA
ncbi:MAG TPA: response regulator [Desulfonatronum sp.]|nr:response regulator [Desulfonatronum sp.]